MIDRLGPLTRAIATLRKSLAEPGARATGATASGAAATPRRPEETSGGQTSRSHVEDLASRLASIGRDDPQRTRKALRLFIEAVLLDEFGDALVLNAEFEQIVDRSVSAMEADEGLSETLAEAMKELLGRSAA